MLRAESCSCGCGVSIYIWALLASFALLGLTLIPVVAALLGAFLAVLQVIAVILVILFAAVIIIKALIKLFGR